MITCNHDNVGVTLAVARSSVKGRGKPCPYNTKWSLYAEIFVVMYNTFFPARMCSKAEITDFLPYHNFKL